MRAWTIKLSGEFWRQGHHVREYMVRRRGQAVGTSSAVVWLDDDGLTRCTSCYESRYDRMRTACPHCLALRRYVLAEERGA